MPLQLFNPLKFLLKTCVETNLTPDGVLADHHLTIMQKSVILEAMLTEVRDAIEIEQMNGRGIYSKSNARQVEAIVKSQLALKSQMT